MDPCSPLPEFTSTDRNEADKTVARHIELYGECKDKQAVLRACVKAFNER